MDESVTIVATKFSQEISHQLLVALPPLSRLQPHGLGREADPRPWSGAVIKLGHETS
jgi:hypothetical protein